MYDTVSFVSPIQAPPLTPLVTYLVSVQHSWLLYASPLSLTLPCTASHCLTIPAHCPSQPCHISQPCCALWHLHSLALSRPVQPSDSSSLLSQFVLSVLPIVLALPQQSRTLPRQSRMAVSATLWHSLSHIVAPSQTIKGQSLPPVFPQFLAGFNLSHLQLNPSIPLRVAFLHKLCSRLRRNTTLIQTRLSPELPKTRCTDPTLASALGSHLHDHARRPTLFGPWNPTSAYYIHVNNTWMLVGNADYLVVSPAPGTNTLVVCHTGLVKSQGCVFVTNYQFAMQG